MQLQRKHDEDIAKKLLRLWLIGFFDGIGGPRARVTRLPVVVLGFASAELGKDVRLLRERWPGLVDWGRLGSRRGCDSQTFRHLRTAGGLCSSPGGNRCEDLGSLSVTCEN